MNENNFKDKSESKYSNTQEDSPKKHIGSIMFGILNVFFIAFIIYIIYSAFFGSSSPNNNAPTNILGYSNKVENNLFNETLSKINQKFKTHFLKPVLYALIFISPFWILVKMSGKKDAVASDFFPTLIILLYLMFLYISTDSGSNSAMIQ